MKLTQLLSCYLPTRLRRWFIYLPLNAFLLLVLLTLGILIRATFITASPLYNTKQVPTEVEEQFKWLGATVERSADQAKLDLYTGYTDFCGEYYEWNYGFYIFYALCLDELIRIQPERQTFAARQIDLCTRLIMRLPIHASDAEIAEILDEAGSYSGSLTTGYQCLVLSIRKSIVGDSLYDSTIHGIATALERDLRLQLDNCSGIWTSDQSTQLHAIWRADQALDNDHRELYDLWLTTMQDRFMETDTDILQSRISIQPDRIDSEPRATSIAWSIIFLADLYPEFAAQQYEALLEYRVRRFANLAAVAEFPGVNPLNYGDIDSGPIILDISPAATGFALAAHRLYGQQSDFQRCYRMFELFGLRKNDEDGQRYRLSNAMGDAILLYGKIARHRPQTGTPPNRP